MPVVGHVNVTGGEPFVRKDFLDLLKALSAERPRITFGILTNGTLIDRRMAVRLRELGATFVQVSVEGTEATHDRIRGAGNHRATVAALRNLVREGVPTSVSFTAHRENYREFPEVARLARKLRVTRVWSDRLIPMGRGSQLESLPPGETRDYLRSLHMARHEAEDAWRNRTTVSLIRALQFLAGGRPYHCKAGDALITILPSGDLCPCRRGGCPSESATCSRNPC
jgi:MoaA/NifB/PqqE/SkfB family radical SAM enzyme